MSGLGRRWHVGAGRPGVGGAGWRKEPYSPTRDVHILDRRRAVVKRDARKHDSANSIEISITVAAGRSRNVDVMDT